LGPRPSDSAAGSGTSMVKFRTLPVKSKQGAIISANRQMFTTCPRCGKGTWRFFLVVKKGVQLGTYSGLCNHCFWATKTGQNNPRWRGGSMDRGYKLVPIESNSKVCTGMGIKRKGRRTQRCREHRVVAAQIISRPLRHNERVHHLNGNKSDNRPQNLVLMSEREHNRFEVALFCGRTLRKEAINWPSAAYLGNTR
jgi:hypothetical protein